MIRPTEADIEESLGYLNGYIRQAGEYNVAVALGTGNMFITHYVLLGLIPERAERKEVRM